MLLPMLVKFDMESKRKYYYFIDIPISRVFPLRNYFPRIKHEFTVPLKFSAK